MIHDINLEKSRDKIKAAYEASSFAKGIRPEPALKEPCGAGIGIGEAVQRIVR